MEAARATVEARIKHWTWYSLRKKHATHQRNSRTKTTLQALIIGGTN
jgi:hypothetical protein